MRDHPANAAVLHRCAEVVAFLVVVIRALHRLAAIVVQPVPDEQMPVAPHAGLRFLILRRRVLRPLQLIVSAAIGMHRERQFKRQRLVKIRHELSRRMTLPEKIKPRLWSGMRPWFRKRRRTCDGHATPQPRIVRLGVFAKNIPPAFQSMRPLFRKPEHTRDAVIILQRLAIRQQPCEKLPAAITSRNLCQRIRLRPEHVLQKLPLRKRQRRHRSLHLRQLRRRQLHAKPLAQRIAPAREIPCGDRLFCKRSPRFHRPRDRRRRRDRGKRRRDDGDGYGEKQDGFH